MSNETYDERKRMEAENRLLHEKRVNDRLRKEAMSEAAFEAIVTGLQALFQGDACIEMGPAAGGGFIIKFRSLVPKSQG